MQRALGSNRAEYSRKQEAITTIMISRSITGMDMDAVKESVKGYRRKKLSELQEISKVEFKKYQESKRMRG